MVQLPFPINEQGFIDEKKIFQIVIGKLKLPLSYLDELAPIEIGWLLESHIEEQMEYYEHISSAVMFGYASAQKGKKLPMFKKHEKQMVKRITQEQREKEIKYLENVFAEGESS